MPPKFMPIFMSYHFIIKSPILSYFLVFLLLHFCTSLDTINSTHPLKVGDVLISNGETFAMGFFSPNNSNNHYIGIWYNKVSERTIVWVANRDSPLTNTTGYLIVDDTGNLIIRDNEEQNIIAWSTNVHAFTSRPSNCYGQLLDSGNLVLFQDGVVAWQGFDYPTDTMLPYMKLGWDRKTGLNRVLTSWKSSDDPGRGEYFHQIDFDSLRPPQLFLYNGTSPLWRAGTWIGRGWSGIEQMSQKSIFNSSYIYNQDEGTIVWGVLNSSIFSRIIVTRLGTIDRLTWLETDSKWVRFYSVPNERCDNYNHCGPFGYCDGLSSGFECECFLGFEPRSPRDWYLRDGSKGCTRKSGVSVCGAGEGFVKLARAKVPDISKAHVDMNVGLKECEDLCLKNCSCLGYASGIVSDGGGCVSWFAEMNDTRHFMDWGQDLYIRVDAAELAKYSKKSSFNKLRVVVLGLPLVTAVVLIIFTAIWCARKKRVCSSIVMSRQGEVLFDLNTSSNHEWSTTRKETDRSGENIDLCMFDLSTLVAATENFDPSNKIGAGGFGSVYKGQLTNGQEIAVKRLSNCSVQGMEEFGNEVTLIAKLQHRNLVRLLGCCVQEDEKMLVYEYLQNKGLDSFLFDDNKAALLEWRKRFEIILGIVRGLLYLHQDSRFRIIHRDLKASNVLLDSSLNPKISDFGMARIFGGDQVEAITNRVVGTYGYMSPEYAMEGLFSIKSDVFSLGVLILEIISGRKNSSYYQQHYVTLVGHVWELWREGAALNIIDPSMADSYVESDVLRCIHVGLLCVQEHANDRPTMSEVYFMLCNETNLHSPNRPAFVFRRLNNGTDSRTAGGRTISINEVTLTAVEGR